MLYSRTRILRPAVRRARSIIAHALGCVVAVTLWLPSPAHAQRPNRAVSAPLPLTPFTPPPGPPPRGVSIDHQGTYGVIAKLFWEPTANAVSYLVERRLYDDPACCNASSGPLTTTSWVDKGLVRKGMYVFTVYAQYADGSVGKQEVGIASEGVRNPVVTVQDTGPGRVRLNWDNGIAGTSGFMVYGPGMGAGRSVSGDSVEAALLPPGTHTWTIASIYAQGLGILSPPADWTQVTHTLNYGAGRFRVSLEGFKAVNVTAEDIFRSDGRGDEIFIATQVNEYEITGTLSSARMTRTPTFGDAQNFPARVRAGSASASGGIMPGDQYPPLPQYIADMQPPTTNNLPYVLWEGDLTEIRGGVIFSPSIWESDEDDRLFANFAAFHAANAPNLLVRPGLGAYVPRVWSTQPVAYDWRPDRSCPTPPSPESAPNVFVPSIGSWRDEPIDLNQDRTYCPLYFAVNWRMAQAQTSVNPASILEIPFTNPATKWQYILYVRIERVSSPKVFTKKRL